MQVGVINFSPQAKSEDSEFAEVVSHTGNGIVSVTCRDDVMSVDKYKVKVIPPPLQPVHGSIKLWL